MSTEAGEEIDLACDAVALAFTRGCSPSRDDLLWTAMNAWAPAPIIALLSGLAVRPYFDLAEVREELARSTA